MALCLAKITLTAAYATLSSALADCLFEGCPFDATAGQDSGMRSADVSMDIAVDSLVVAADLQEHALSEKRMMYFGLRYLGPGQVLQADRGLAVIERLVRRALLPVTKQLSPDHKQCQPPSAPYSSSQPHLAL